MAESPVIDRVHDLVQPIASDLHLDVYDIEMRGGTLRVMLDTPPDSEAGLDLETITLATRLISTELDHTDPIPGSYNLEVSSPGLERPLRTPQQFQRSVGKQVSVRLSNTEHRRVQGTLVAADDVSATVEATVVDGAPVSEPVVRQFKIADVDKARTLFEWGPQPKKGGQKNGKQPKRTTGKKKR